MSYTTTNDTTTRRTELNPSADRTYGMDRSDREAGRDVTIVGAAAIVCVLLMYAIEKIF